MPLIDHNTYDFIVSGTCTVGNGAAGEFRLAVTANDVDQAQKIVTNNLHAAGYQNVIVQKTELVKGE